MLSTGLVTTGIKEIDQKLAQLEPKLQKKFVRSALRNGGKLVAAEAKQIIDAEAYDTGALYESVKVKASKRSRNKIGIIVFPPRALLFDNYEATHGHLPHPSKKDRDAHYYVADIEFGNENLPPVRPFRRALYENEQQIKQDFRDDLLSVLKSDAITPGGGGSTNSELRQAATAAGELAYRDVAGRLQSVKGGYISLPGARSLGYTGQ